jgi:hypothetical protein
MDFGQTYEGIVQGNSIHLDQASGFADGTKVTISLRPKDLKSRSGEGLRATAGVFAEHPEFGQTIERIIQDRQHDTRQEIGDDFCT